MGPARISMGGGAGVGGCLDARVAASRVPWRAINMRLGWPSCLGGLPYLIFPISVCPIITFGFDSISLVAVTAPLSD